MLAGGGEAGGVVCRAAACAARAGGVPSVPRGVHAPVRSLAVMITDTLALYFGLHMFIRLTMGSKDLQYQAMNLLLVAVSIDLSPLLVYIEYMLLIRVTGKRLRSCTRRGPAAWPSRWDGGARRRPPSVIGSSAASSATSLPPFSPIWACLRRLRTARSVLPHSTPCTDGLDQRTL